MNVQPLGPWSRRYRNTRTVVVTGFVTAFFIA